MAEEAKPEGAQSPHALAHALEPALVLACGGRISGVRWFKADWQRGGAATAYATFRAPDGGGGESERDVVVKIPVGPVEHRFTTGLSGTCAPTPRVVASGEELGGYDLAWLVMERFAGDPLAARIHHELFAELADAAALFYRETEEVFGLAENLPPAVDWEELVQRARGAIRDNDIADAGRWKKALKHVHRALPGIVARWRGRRVNCWCHGDLHPGNAMRREEGSVWGKGGCMLLDLAEVHAGHWVEDAVYLERIYWGRPELVEEVRPVKLIGRARKDLGLAVEDGDALLADLRRVLIAACVPAFLHREGHPAYLSGSLDVLERVLPRVVD